MDKVRDFKNAVRLYYYHKTQIHYLNGRLMHIKDQLGKVKSPSFSSDARGLPSHTMMDYFDEEQQLCKELTKHEYNVWWVDTIFKKVSQEALEILKKVYLNKTHTYEQLSFDLYRNDRKLKQRLDDELLKIL